MNVIRHISYVGIFRIIYFVVLSLLFFLQKRKKKEEFFRLPNLLGPVVVKFSNAPRNIYSIISSSLNFAIPPLRLRDSSVTPLRDVEVDRKVMASLDVPMHRRFCLILDAQHELT